MLHKVILYTIIFLITDSAFSQSIGDSVLQERSKAYSDYRDFRENMGERTWLNLVNLTLRAEDILEMDNNIIHNYLNKELERNKSLSEQNNSLNLDIAVLKNEIASKNKLLDDRDYYFNILMYLAIIFLILLIVVTFLYINRLVKNKSLQIELERQWAQPEDKISKAYYEDEIARISAQRKNLETENQELKIKLEKSLTHDRKEDNSEYKNQIDQLKKQNNNLAEDKFELEQKLEKELATRKNIEAEIRELIKQADRK
jgi:hypothetical protein